MTTASLPLWQKGALGAPIPATARILFGQMREDAAVEIALLPPMETGDRVFAIASGGCTAFALAAHTDADVLAVDVNPAQIALCRLKAACLRHLPRHDLLRAIDRDARFASAQLSFHLDEETAGFWAARPNDLRYGLNRAGHVDRGMRRLAALFRVFLVSPSAVDALLEGSDLPLQATVFETRWKTRRWRVAFRIALSRTFLRSIYGRKALEPLPLDFPDLIQRKVARLTTAFPARENPYLWQTFAGRYASDKDEALPPYLQAEAVERLRAGRGPRFEVAPAAERLEQEPPQSLRFLALSNILEGMPATEATRLWRAAVRAAAPGARIVVRSIFSDPRDSVPAGLPLTWDEEASRIATQRDRSVICGHVFVFQVTV